MSRLMYSGSTGGRPSERTVIYYGPLLCRLVSGFVYVSVIYERGYNDDCSDCSVYNVDDHVHFFVSFS